MRDELRAMCKDGVTTLSRAVHHAATWRNKIERDAGLWIADAEQATRIAEPAADLLAEAVPEAWLSSTVITGLKLLFGVGSYLDDHLTTKTALRWQHAESKPIRDVSGEMQHAEPAPVA